MTIVATVSEDERLIRSEIEKVEADTGNIGDEQINCVEHCEYVTIQEHLVVLVSVVNQLVCLVDEIDYLLMGTDHARVRRSADARVWFVDHACPRKRDSGCDYLRAEHIY